MAREKVTFRANQPEVIRLDRADSKEVDGREGPQYMRILDNDARILFADPALEDAIVRSGAAEGDAIQIIKRPGGNWEVGIVSEGHNATARRAASAPPERRPAARSTQPAQHQPAALPAITPQSLDLMGALKSAIDAAIEAERYAASQDYPLTFDASDIRTMANSIICRREGGR